VSIYETKWYKEQVRKAVEEMDKQTVKRMIELKEKLDKKKEGGGMKEEMKGCFHEWINDYKKNINRKVYEVYWKCKHCEGERKTVFVSGEESEENEGKRKKIY